MRKRCAIIYETVLLNDGMFCNQSIPRFDEIMLQARAPLPISALCAVSLFRTALLLRAGVKSSLKG